MASVQEAVSDQEWQAFRKSLRGMSTARKLHELHEYFVIAEYRHSDYDSSDGPFEKIKVQIDNYIKALCRGGQLYPGESLQTALDNGWDLKIKS
jgi:hypothetical protein